MPKGLNVDKINEYNEAKSAWEEEEEEEQQQQQQQQQQQG